MSLSGLILLFFIALIFSLLSLLSKGAPLFFLHLFGDIKKS